MTDSTAVAPLPAKRMTMVWAITVVLVFLVLVLLGLTMRLNQGAAIAISPDRFYAIMTLHGLGMAGTLFIGGVAAIWYRSLRYVRPSLALLRWVYGLVLAGTVGLIAATLLGRYGPGWYMLYPLPFVQLWPHWSTGLAVVSVLVLGVAWLLAQLDLLRAFAARYGVGRLLAWDYLSGASPADPLPPFILIATVALLAGALTTVVGAVVLLLYLFQWFMPALHFDPLLLKNMMFLFGHTIVNITMYLGIALVYERLPEYTGRKWSTNRIVAIAWNATLLFVLTAFFHHLYMDFAQPGAVQMIGQIASYLSAVPATAVTLFGAATQVYRADVRWRFAPLAYYTGLVGWTVGGLAAVVDSTIAVNLFFHNTLWVPAHFHTYFLAGYVLMLLAAFHEIAAPEAQRWAKAGLAMLLVGAYGFLVMFYVGGEQGVPRRYASYAAIPVEGLANTGRVLALVAAVFVVLVILGLVAYGVSLLQGWRRSWTEA